jgi:hypothetical protein
VDDERARDGALADPELREETGSLHVPQMTQGTGATEPPLGTTAADDLRGKDALTADITAAWTKLDSSARLLVNASTAALILVLIGLPLSVWDSANFALLVLTAAVFSIVTAWFGATPTARSMPIPIPTIELVATVVAAILAILKVLEVLFDIDSDGVVGLVVSVALAVATMAMVVAATRRGADPVGAITGGDQGVKIAAVGLAIVLIGWAINLSVGFWVIGAAALPLAVLTIAALTVVEAPRITSPIPVAWVGAAIAVFGVLLAISYWGDFARLGRTEVSLDLIDYLGFFGFALGAVVIVVGGALSGQAVWATRQPATAATPSAPSAPWVPASTTDAPPDDDREEPAG